MFINSRFMVQLPPELSPAPSSAEASATETPATETPSTEAAKAGLTSERIGSRHSATIEPAEGAGMHSAGRVAAKPLMPGKAVATKIAGMIEVRASRIKTIAIDDGTAMRNVSIVIEFDSPAVMPIISPSVPTPAEACE
jgi:hypothetical protein